MLLCAFTISICHGLDFSRSFFSHYDTFENSLLFLLEF